MSRVHGLDSVAEVVEQTSEEFERPTVAAKRFPDFAVVLKGTE